MKRSTVTKLLTLTTLSVVCFSTIVYATGIKFSYSKVSSKYPCQNTSVTYSAKIINSSSDPVSDAKVTFKVYYKTKTTSYSAGYSNSSGKVSKKFKIGMATANYKVVVKSKASKNGSTATSSTWFKPKACD